MKLKIFLTVAAITYSVNSFAMFCPTNFNQINFGDSVIQVEAQCGKPTSFVTSKEEADVPQEWTFYAMAPTDPLTSVGTVKVTAAFADGKIVNITSGGYSVGATTVCNGNSIQIGSTSKQVRAACGEPAMKTLGAPKPGIAPPITDETMEWTYKGPPAVILTFVNGKLTERK